MTRLTKGLIAVSETDEQKEAMSPRWIAVVATWLASPEAKNVTGRVFDVRGNKLAIAEGWVRGSDLIQPDDPTQLGSVVAELMAHARLNSDMNGRPKNGPGRPGLTI